jgi:hypothetical protein
MVSPNVLADLHDGRRAVIRSKCLHNPQAQIVTPNHFISF